MISIKALGMYSSDFSGGETRNGDTQIATDGKNFDVIDGGCDRYATRLIAHLKSINIRDPYLHISHCHYDHRDGINKILSDPWFTPRGLYCQDPDSITGHSGAIRSDINALRKIIDKAKSKGIPVIYLGNEGKIEHGEIKITVYRQYPKYSGNSDAYLNDGSLCYWFAAQRYLTTGDASMWCAYKYNLNPLIVKGGHHGNDMSADGYLKPSQMCPWLYKRGCRFYWDNDFSTKLTDFLMTGREDAINAGMTFIDIHGDIDMVFAEGKVTIKHAGKTYTAEVPYQGKMLKASWEKGSKGMWYRYPDGSWATGWALIDKKWYYFDADGWMLTGWRELQWSQSKKKNKKDWFFFDQKTGVMLTGWQVLLWSGGVSTFCFDENGVMLTGWHWLTKDGKTGWYYFENSGAMHTGWIFDDGAWYYLGTDGKMVTGWVTYKGKKCYLEPKSDRTHVQGQCYISRTATIDGKTYRFDKDGYAEEITASGGGNITNVSGKLNDISASRRQFVIDIANYVRKYAPQYGIKVYSPVIAQAIHESGWGESKLSAKYHNYFGLKCGTKWTGKSVNMKTQEEYSAGSLSTISANFRAYDSMEEGVKGYFDFIQLPRYANLKGVTSPRQYLQNIKDDGYATGSQYVDHVMNTLNLYNLTQFDAPVSQPAAKPTEDPVDVLIRIMEAEVGTHEGPNNHTKYGDEMHAIQPSNMDKNAPWCDAFFDWCILKLCEYFGYGADMARKVLCGDFDDYTYASVALYKKAGRWFDKPQRGDQIFFGGSGHTGGVVSVYGGTENTIEGNKGDEVRRCSYSIHSPSIIGYGRPRYYLLTGRQTAADMPLIKKGSKGSAVLQLQKILNSKGYKLSEDSDFGPATEAAVKAFQKANGLNPVDGEVGPITWTALLK